MDVYRIKFLAETVFGLITAAAIAGLAAVQAGDPAVILNPGVILLAVAGGVTRFLAANIQNIIVQLTGVAPGS